MKFLRSLKSLLTIVFAMGFLFTVATTSCGPKKAESDTEQVEEHPSEDEHPSESEHPTEGEHPSDGGDEHPSND